MGTLSKEFLDKYAKGSIFIETGSYHGDAVQLAKEYGFKTIHSIELNDNLFEMVRVKFINDNNIKIWHGDSIDIFKELIPTLHEQATFWLDAHASGPLRGGKYGASPLIYELEAIAKSPIKTHVIIIDDCREFGQWGLKKEEVIFQLQKINPNYIFEFYDGTVPNDILIAFEKF